jgi:hypothetical protein
MESETAVAQVAEISKLMDRYKALANPFTGPRYSHADRIKGLRLCYAFALIAGVPIEPPTRWPHPHWIAEHNPASIDEWIAEQIAKLEAALR